MAQLRTDKIVLSKDFQLDFGNGWTLNIDVRSSPVNYTLTHGKKSINFDSNTMQTLCSREYGVRLVKGRRQMVVPPHVLQSFVDNAVFLQWYSTNQNQDESHVTFST